MFSPTQISRQEIIETVQQRVASEFPESLQQSIHSLIHRCFSYVAPEDLVKIELEDLRGLILSLWQHLEHWTAKRPKINILNPNLEENDWQSSHSIIMILAKEIPFVLDSVRLGLNRAGLNIHIVFHSTLGVERDAQGHLTSINQNSDNKELLVCFEIDHVSDAEKITDLNTEIETILSDVELATADFDAMQAKVAAKIEELGKTPPVGIPSDEVDETRVFLKWLSNNHFSFLAYDEYELKDAKVIQVPDSALGLFKKNKKLKVEDLSELTEDMQGFAYEAKLLTFMKSGHKSKVHRETYSDYILIKQFDEKGNVIGGARILGLYTSSVYNNSAQNIPVVRKKILQVLEKSEFFPGTHNYKELAQILYSLPKDELIQSSIEELLTVSQQVLAIQERKRIRLFVRKDVYGKFISSLLYIPKDIYNTVLREQIRLMLMEHFDVESWDFTTFFSESVLARTRYVFKLKKPMTEEIDVMALEQKAIAISRHWKDDFKSALIDSVGEERGIELYRRYHNSFPSGYQDNYSPRVAVIDLQRMESLYSDDSTSLALSFYRSHEPSGSQLNLKIFHQQHSLLLSDLIPVLENLGLKVVDEFPYQIKIENNQSCWIYDFTLLYPDDENLEPANYREQFNQAFHAIWYGKAENDEFNRLILKGNLNWRQAAMLRAYAKYMKQIGSTFSPQFIAETLLSHTAIVEQLNKLFELRFDPKHSKRNESREEKIVSRIETLLDAVENLSEDRILRKYVELISATVRTNFYQTRDGREKDYVSFKFLPRMITDLPLPYPKYEIFVYSPKVEGVHLRGGKVARGGLRWSDRNEDFRTEVLGLVKAQQVKNSVIVPVGAKGGFVAKQLPANGSREEIQAEGIACYRWFIRGLLDITDNLINGEVVPPKQVIRYDEDDPYLVVAADKGTATFSDIANELALEYGHWLGDAFASGGSHGYDHKKMGITAKGAWVSVQRHFRELGIDVQQDEFTVIGIGDMAGDVFGNGLLRSDKARLIAAFNHMHIFVDPDPDASSAFAERKRLFELPRSSWSDYDTKLISSGGGVFLRSAKSITITKEMKARFEIKEDRLTPNELISAILKAPVDLLWNGGIGTYVKSFSESHTDVGDKSNDNVRVNGRDLRARVVGEGGNLGLTQLGRIEYGLKGGRSFTDFIDNAGGVDCSDHEVNIKILLDRLVHNGDLTEKQRNIRLEEMTEEVSRLVLTNNYRQAQILSLCDSESLARIEEYRRFISTMEAEDKLNRELEFIPSDEQISERKNSRLGLTRPELSVLISYGKGDLKEQLIKANIGDDPYVVREIETALPAVLVKDYYDAVYNHPLKNEIVATQVANDLYNHMGITYLTRVQESTGSTVCEVAKAYVAARDVFGLKQIWRDIEDLGSQIESSVLNRMMLKTSRSVRRASRWFIKNNRLGIQVENIIAEYQPAIEKLSDNFPDILVGETQQQWLEAVQKLVDHNVPEVLAAKVVTTDFLYNCLGVIAVASTTGTSVIESARTFFRIGDELNLIDFGDQLNQLSVGSHWQARAREAYRDDLEWQQRSITQSLLKAKTKDQDMDTVLSSWREKNEVLVNRWHRMMKEIKTASDVEFSMYSVAIRELLDLSQVTKIE
ncbi:NAD-glutamate dehydrogenase [Gynuella sunshinyii]|uniref:NAD-specific glutamate dehydrogenase n=1 Tax=Gynuella sunshinyii YC6258 TaxID=1445510 RepID=A0A0C5V7M8_9GAMM|nr:NAD-glutamate dehydrogenase [Gynuella sunshinyii]AJQ95430.1 NAD-specific glutamate dehydrogenase [Gynuella sunshinyii YC6258]